MKLLEFTGFARYVYAGAEEMRPMGSEFRERIVIEVKEGTPIEDVKRFEEEVLRVSTPTKSGVSIDFGSGICGIWYPKTRSGKTIIDVPFCGDASEIHKSELRSKVKDSPIVRTIYEDLKFKDIEEL
ncbi:MAG: hypothetical protein HKN33_11255 [Pyrinomonadaceae bacterium]|nr:hypothetical protein [Pyrinomonadaceae bacterium]